MQRSSIKYKGWVLDRWAELALAGQPVRRVIGYNAAETGRAAKDSMLQERHNKPAARTLCVPWYPLIERGWTREALADYIEARTGERLGKSACVFCPYSNRADARPVLEARFRAHPAAAVRALMLEHAALALNERSPLYGTDSLAGRLAADPRNHPLLAAHRAVLRRTPAAVYKVRRIYTAARTPLCRQLHGDRCTRASWWCHHPRTPACTRDHGTVPTCGGGMGCTLAPRKGTAWRSVTAIARGSYGHCTQLLHRLALDAPQLEDVTGDLSGIRRLWSLPPGTGYPRAESFLVVAPATIRDKERPGFNARWRALTGQQQWEERVAVGSGKALDQLP